MKTNIKGRSLSNGLLLCDAAPEELRLHLKKKDFKIPEFACPSIRRRLYANSRYLKEESLSLFYYCAYFNNNFYISWKGPQNKKKIHDSTPATIYLLSLIRPLSWVLLLVARAGKTITPTDLHRRRAQKRREKKFLLLLSIRQHPGTHVYTQSFLVFFDDSRCFLKKTPQGRTSGERERTRDWCCV